MHHTGGMTPTQALIGTAEACVLLGVDRSTLTRWVGAGRITPQHKLPGSNGAYLFAEDVIASLQGKP